MSSWADGVAEGVRRARADGYVVSDALIRRLSTPQGFVDVLANAERNAREAFEKADSLARQGLFSADRLFGLTRAQKAVWEAQYAIYQALRSVGVTVPRPDEPGTLRLVGARTLGTLGTPLALAPAAGLSVSAGVVQTAFWAVAGVFTVAVLAAVAMFLGGIIAYLVYTVIVGDQLAEAEKQRNAAVSNVIRRCVDGGGNAVQCVQAAGAAVPPPKRGGGAGPETWPWIPVVAGVTVVGGLAYVAAAAVGGRKGGGDTVIVAGSGSDSRGPSMFTQENASTFAVPVILLGLIGGAIYMMRQVPPAEEFTPPEAPEAPEALEGLRGMRLGSLYGQLQGQGRFAQGRQHMPQQVSFDRFTSSAGPRYDLEVR